MKLLAALSITLALATNVLGHYRFLNLNGSGDYQYIRQYDNYYSNGPITDVSSTDIRCNLNGAGKTTGTLTVAAGSTATFTVPNGISHPGPLLFYMAKAPSTVNGWDGSGKVWFKIAQTGATFSPGQINWPSSGKTSVSVTIPRSVPSGEYILRVEHIALHSASSTGGAQFYISCAQIKVTGGGSGNPGPLVSFPGAYSASDPSILINIYYPVPTSYTPPGPSVWQG
ncbi:Probable endo-beta-1,4-glucanase D Short=Endoglucanase D; AltName: Full=Carboxymethylcellulase D; AltName: Full=Cellulase D; Flags: Precursor [Serendipita indica DSM 11827]|uniref:lytic cellulose monooxygenase (C4-dehydrogenating) n=1 Tax=Serendipita indica (strain DSM 11827) TaxID=1109443 RepID=G4TSF3_SERID|nr:Probable endo-beta-1,4-glucanase D Short=Endoglucanase D; AltName: Full=Carboxymethylcellulase D; AltName: Full=Cellulase D; Flags: Precursor [Serendipita indica DSM 11827]CCA74246.1 related to cellulose binding protein CEL1 [Serendipita indica DSM 11827]